MKAPRPMDLSPRPRRDSRSEPPADAPIDHDRADPKPRPPELSATSQPATAPSPAPSPPKRRRGPKPGVTPEEMEALCVLWLEKEQYRKLKPFFCDEHGISEYQLDTALSAREMRMKGPEST